MLNLHDLDGVSSAWATSDNNRLRHFDAFRKIQPIAFVRLVIGNVADVARNGYANRPIVR